MSSSSKEGGCETPGSGITPGIADGFATARFASRNRGYALTLRQLLHTAVGSQDSQDSYSPRSLHKHLLLRRGSRLAHHKCLVDLGKLQDSRRDDYNYAMSRHAVHALVHRRRFSSWSDAIRRLHPVSLASELASHNTSADCVLFDPDAFKSWSPTHSICSHTAAQLARICKLQFDPTRHQSALKRLSINEKPLSNKLTQFLTRQPI